MEILISITVCILLSILLAFNVPIREDLLATAGLVGTIIMFLEPIYELNMN